ncbi:hypothetical protein [Rhodanobacter lindaniclasticus]
MDVLRQLLLAGLLIAGGISLGNVILGSPAQSNLAAFVLVLAATALGGSRVPVGGPTTPYIGLDFATLSTPGCSAARAASVPSGARSRAPGRC